MMTVWSIRLFFLAVGGVIVVIAVFLTALTATDNVYLVTVHRNGHSLGIFELNLQLTRKQTDIHNGALALGRVNIATVSGGYLAKILVGVLLILPPAHKSSAGAGNFGGV